MLLEEFDVDKYERTIKAEGKEEGREEILELTRKLIEQNRMDDLKRLAEDSAYREQLFREFGLQKINFFIIMLKKYIKNEENIVLCIIRTSSKYILIGE